jgi:hypothetical protein
MGWSREIAECYPQRADDSCDAPADPTQNDPVPAVDCHNITPPSYRNGGPAYSSSIIDSRADGRVRPAISDAQLGMTMREMMLREASDLDGALRKCKHRNEVAPPEIERLGRLPCDDALL